MCNTGRILKSMQEEKEPNSMQIVSYASINFKLTWLVHDLVVLVQLLSADSVAATIEFQHSRLSMVKKIPD